MLSLRKIALLVVAAMPLLAFSHGDLHERILYHTFLIENHPDSAMLFLERGELYYQHESYEEALADFETYRSHGAISNRFYLSNAKANLKSGQLETAMASIDELLEIETNDVRALRLKGNVFEAMGRFTEAAGHYEKVISLAEKTFTENYFETSTAWEKAGTEEGFDHAVQVLEKGIEDLGPLLVLHDRLVSLHTDNGYFNEAIDWQNRILELSPRKERPYYDRAMIFLEMGDIESAKLDFDQAKQAISQLPVRIRNVESTRQLSAEILRQSKDIIP